MRRRRKAVSTIVATILAVNMAIVMGGILVAWAMGLLGSYEGGTRAQYILMGEKMQEVIVIEDVQFTTLFFKMITVYVRNVGVREAKLVALYINGQYVSTMWLPYVLPVGGWTALVTLYTWTSGANYLIVVATARGNQARGEWVA